MPMRWHHSRQGLFDRPISPSTLRQLAADGRIQPCDLIRREGSTQWVPAAKVEALFGPDVHEWYYTRKGKPTGPVPLRRLRELAAAGRLGADDLVRKRGLARWKPARTLKGLFPASAVPRASALPGRTEPTVLEVETIALPRFKERFVPTLSEVFRHREWMSWLDRLRSFSRSRGQRTPVIADPLVRLVGRMRTLFVSLVLLCLAVVGSVWGVQAPRRSASRVDEANDVRPLRPEPRASRERSSASNERQGDYGHPRSRAENGRTDRPALSIDLERRLGQAAHNHVLRNYPVMEPEALRQRADRVAQPLFAACRRKEIDYSLTILESEEVFAFSHLGGYLYVSRGLLEFAADDEELRFAIGHELAHLDLEHGGPDLARLASDARARGEADASIARQIVAMGAARHDEDEESTADACAVQALVHSGASRRQCLAFPTRFSVYLQRHSAGAEARHSLAGSSLTPCALDHHWNAAPAATRLARLRALVSRAFAVPKNAERSTAWTRP